METEVQEVISITQNEKGDIAVSGRELHGFLNVRERYNDWFKRMLTYGFSENVDFISFTGKTVKPKGGRPTKDHALTLDMAKEIAMIQRTDRGKQARQYFIAVEKQFKQQSDLSQLSPELQLMSQMINQLAKQEVAQKQLEAKVDHISETVSVNIRHDWRKQTQQLINAVAGKYGHNQFGTVKAEIFRELEARAGVNLTTRLSNQKSRMQEAGATAAAVSRASKVDVIAADRKLIEIYIQIVKEFAVANAVYSGQLDGMIGGTAA